jgi:hypothetical protein
MRDDQKNRYVEIVTCTGVDERTSLDDLHRMSGQFPFAEWGVLVSKAKTGQEREPRYPPLPWIKELVDMKRGYGRFADFGRARVRLSMHLCGVLAREFLAGDWDGLREFLRPAGADLDDFDRIQLNVAPAMADAAFKVDPMATARPILERRLAMKQPDGFPQIIVQTQGAPGRRLVRDLMSLGIKASCLNDHSGGRGEVPKDWPIGGSEGVLTGFAGGLGPDNAAGHLDTIRMVSPARAWIDAESGLRTDDRFDASKARRFLLAARPWTVISRPEDDYRSICLGCGWILEGAESHCPCVDEEKKRMDAEVSAYFRDNPEPHGRRDPTADVADIGRGFVAFEGSLPPRASMKAMRRMSLTI